MYRSKVVLEPSTPALLTSHIHPANYDLLAGRGGAAWGGGAAQYNCRMKKKGNGARVTIITPTPDHSQHSINYILAPWYFYHFWWCQRNFAKVLTFQTISPRCREPSTGSCRWWSWAPSPAWAASRRSSCRRRSGGTSPTRWRRARGSAAWTGATCCSVPRRGGWGQLDMATRRNVWFCSNFEETREAVNKIEIHEAANKTEATSLWETRQHELCYITQQIKWLALWELQVTLIGLSRSIWLHLFQLDVTRPADCFDVF